MNGTCPVNEVSVGAAAAPDRTRPRPPRRFLKRALLGLAGLLILAEIVVRVAGLDPSPYPSQKDIEAVENLRRHIVNYPGVEAELARARTELARLQQAKADAAKVEKARKDLCKAEDQTTWEKAHWPSHKFRFCGYWAGVPIQFEQEVELNHLWMRDYTYEPNKPPNVRRMIILGDSYTTAWEVKFDEMYHKRLARELTRLAGPGRRVEVPAFSKPSMGLSEMKDTFLDRVMAYQPDMLTLVVAGTLISENYRPLQNELDFKFGRLKKYVLNAGEVESRWLLVRRSALNRLVARLAGMFYIYRLDWFEDLDGRHPLDASVATYFEPTPPKWEKAWEATFKVLEGFSQACKRAGIPLLVVVMPTEPAINSIFAQPAPGYRIDWTKVDRRFAEMCQRIDADFLTMTGGFDAYRARHGRDYRFTYDIHWNARGHELAAEIILERLRTRYARELGLAASPATTRASE